MADIKIGDIAVYEDDDGKAVWEFEGKVQSDIPLDTDAQDFAGAINELKKLSEAGGGEDWQPPESWIEVPEPGDYDIYILIRTYTDDYGFGKRFEYMLGRKSDGWIGYGHIHCDWGDGTADDYYKDGYPEHTYMEDGQYLVHLTADENTTFCSGSSTLQAQWLIFKSGAKMTFFTDNSLAGGSTFINKDCLKYVKINHPMGLSLLERDSFFYHCRSLQKLELKPIYSGNILPNTFSECFALKKFPVDFDNIDFVGRFAFQQCYNLKNLQMANCLSIDGFAFDLARGLETIILPNCTDIGENVFSSCYCLKSVYAPNCVSIGNEAFSNCFNLQEIILAENCTFGTNCFRNCYSLYPRPDGSIN